MIDKEYREIWEKIESFNLDDPQANVKFSHKLATENNWTPAFTSKVIIEYKKFILLCCVLPGGASPSEIIDQAWHLHLTYTVNYWDEFCGKTLGKDIHHHPSKGGRSEKDKYDGWYQKTLDGYRAVFGELPPADIWPPVAGFEKEKNDLTPFRQLVGKEKKYFLWLAVPLAIPFFYLKAHPFNLAGPQFLVFYAALLLTMFIALFLWYQDKKKKIEDQAGQYLTGKNNVFQISRFVYGRNRSLQAAIIGLVEREILVPQKGDYFTVFPTKYRTAFGETNPLLPALLQQTADGDPVRVSNLSVYYNEDLTYDQNLSLMYKNLVSKDYFSYLLVGIVLLIGVIRFIQGILNEKPTGYLGMMMIAGMLLAWVSITASSYKTLLQQYFKRNYENIIPPATGISTSSVATDFAFLGIVAIGSLSGASILKNTFSREFEKSSYVSNNGCGGSGCGSSCGSSCGSGCGGGGCGGCGGGD